LYCGTWAAALFVVEIIRSIVPRRISSKTARSGPSWAEGNSVERTAPPVRLAISSPNHSAAVL
jgi:hypothetical protein